MKRSCVFRRILIVLAATSVLWNFAARSNPEPSPTPHKKKHRNAEAATPAPSPGPSESKTHRSHQTDNEAGQSTPDASPPAAAEGGFHSSDRESKKTEASSQPESGESGPSVHPSPSPQAAATSTIEASDLRDFDSQPEPVRNLLHSALELTRRNLTYTYGSADPANGGMDCSGTIYFLLKSAGFDDAPRSASEQYSWVRRQSRFYAVLSKKEDSFELKEMRPGDLLFWTGTYHIDHDPPVTHTMLYLGRRKQDGKPLMLGASDGRPYDGEKRNGVSVFDFKMPAARSADAADATTAAAPDHAPDFAGYGPIPGMAERNDAANRQAALQRVPGK